MISSAYETYRQTAVQTSPERLIMMLYEGGIKFLNLARAGIQDNNWGEASRHLHKTQDIVAELLSSVNPEAGEMAQNFTKLYLYMNRRLTDAVLKRDLVPVEEVYHMFSEFKDAWGEIMKKGTPKIREGVKF